MGRIRFLSMGKSRTERLHDMHIYSDLHIMFLLASLMAQLVKNLPVMWETWVVRSLSWEDPWRRERLSIPVFWPGEL